MNQNIQDIQSEKEPVAFSLEGQARQAINQVSDAVRRGVAGVFSQIGQAAQTARNMFQGFFSRNLGAMGAMGVGLVLGALPVDQASAKPNATTGGDEACQTLETEYKTLQGQVAGLFYDDWQERAFQAQHVEANQDAMGEMVSNREALLASEDCKDTALKAKVPKQIAYWNMQKVRLQEGQKMPHLVEVDPSDANARIMTKWAHIPDPSGEISSTKTGPAYEKDPNCVTANAGGGNQGICYLPVSRQSVLVAASTPTVLPVSQNSENSEPVFSEQEGEATPVAQNLENNVKDLIADLKNAEATVRDALHKEFVSSMPQNSSAGERLEEALRYHFSYEPKRGKVYLEVYTTPLPVRQYSGFHGFASQAPQWELASKSQILPPLSVDAYNGDMNDKEALLAWKLEVMGRLKKDNQWMHFLNAPLRTARPKPVQTDPQATQQRRPGPDVHGVHGVHEFDTPIPKLAPSAAARTSAHTLSPEIRALIEGLTRPSTSSTRWSGSPMDAPVRSLWAGSTAGPLGGSGFLNLS